METLTINKIGLQEFKQLIDFVDLSVIQEDLQSVRQATLFNSITLEKFDYYLSFDVEVVLIVRNGKVEILDISINEVELWNEEEQMELSDRMIFELQKEVTKTIKNFI